MVRASSPPARIVTVCSSADSYMQLNRRTCQKFASMFHINRNEKKQVSIPAKLKDAFDPLPLYSILWSGHPPPRIYGLTAGLI
jgi:hypothetical protein